MNSHVDGGPASAGAPVASVRTPSVVEAAKLLSSKGRSEQGAFLVEGPQAVREALAEGLVVKVFATVEGARRCDVEIKMARDIGLSPLMCDEPALNKITDTRTPQGIVAICRVPRWDATPTMPARLIVALDRVADPGNLGTIIRTADAAGADAVLLSPGCADPYGLKVVRSTTGSIFHIPVLIDADLESWAQARTALGMQVLAAAADGQVLTDSRVRERLQQPTMWIFGSEAHGVGAGLRALATESVAIPHYGRAESLNVASAAAVCLFASAMELARVASASTPLAD